MTEAQFRCPTCDAVVSEAQTVCLMCGTAVPPRPAPPLLKPTESDVPAPTQISESLDQADTAEQSIEDELPDLMVESEPLTDELTVLTKMNEPQVKTSGSKEPQRRLFWIITAVFIIALAVVGGLVLRYQEPIVLAQQAAETSTTLPPSATMTPTETAVFTETPAPTLTPTITPTSAPTDTPRPPRIHVIASGETLIGLSFIFRISPESIAEANNIDLDTQVQVNQNLLIPWPTATPPLEILAFDVNGSTVVLDPRGCEQIEVQSGDSLAGIASRYGINFEWLAQINRITSPELLQPGDVVCIPEVLYDGEGVIPPTPGPSPTATATSLPAGPQLLFPPNQMHFADTETPIVLQWLAVQNLGADQQYMVELVDENVLGSKILRAFTKNTSFQLPPNWRPTVPDVHEYRWQVSIVKVLDVRSDGVPIYSLGGEYSKPAIFTWLGAVPTATPQPTFTPSPTATPTPQPTE